jgi:hypothetical protein
MPRNYSAELKSYLWKLQPHQETLGNRLGKACVKANLPATYVAKALDVSHTTLHNWFRGTGVREKNYKSVYQFVEAVEHGIENNTLPAYSLKKAKQFIREVVFGSDI